MRHTRTVRGTLMWFSQRARETLDSRLKCLASGVISLGIVIVLLVFYGQIAPHWILMLGAAIAFFSTAVFFGSALRWPRRRSRRIRRSA